VIVGLPRRATVFRFLDLPAVEEADLGGLLAYEIERHLPFPPDEACFSFQVLEQNGDGAKVLLVAARRTDVESTIERVRALGLRPTAVDVSSLAATSAVLARLGRKRGTLALVSIDEREAEVTVVEKGVLRYSRAFTLDQGGLSPSLIHDLGRALEGRASPSRVLVEGGTEEMRRALAEALGVEVDEWTPRWRVKSDSGETVDSAALGLALRGVSRPLLNIDLLPPEHRVRRRERGVVVMFTLLALIAILGGALGMSAAYRERKALAELSEQARQVKAKAQETEALRAEFVKLRKQLQLLERIAKEQGRPLLALKELVSLMPTDVLLNEFVVEEGKVQIRGTAVTSASELITALERSTLFENAAFTSPISAQGDRQGFQLQVFLKGRSPAPPGRAER
jgi:cell division protein FtsB